MTAQRMPPLNGELRCFVHPSLFESDRDLRSRFIGDLVGVRSNDQCPKQAVLSHIPSQQVGVVVECTPEAPFRFIFYDPAGPPLRNLTKPAVSYHWLDACIKAGRRVDFGPFLAPRNPFSSLPTPRISDHRRSVLTGPSQRIMDTYVRLIAMNFPDTTPGPQTSCKPITRSVDVPGKNCAECHRPHPERRRRSSQLLARRIRKGLALRSSLTVAHAYVARLSRSRDPLCVPQASLHSSAL